MIVIVENKYEFYENFTLPIYINFKTAITIIYNAEKSIISENRASTSGGNRGI